MPLAKKNHTEGSRRIDVRWIQRQGWLEPGHSGSLSWNRRGEPAGSVSYIVQQEDVHFKYQIQSNDGTWIPYNYYVPLTYTDCHYGGQRAWFVCPHCQKRVAILYLVTQIACRTCHNLNYSSQQVTKGVWQNRDRMNKIREKLGWKLFTHLSVCTKPKGMHWKTFNRLRIEHLKYQTLFARGFSNSLEKFKTFRLSEL